VKPARVVIVTRRFWPLVGGAETMTARLAAALADRLDHVTVLTARWQANWPEEIEHHGVRVVRLRQSTVRWWGTWQYMRAVARWLTEHREEVDLVYVSMLKHDAFAAIGVAKKYDMPVVLRAEGGGLTGDVCWQLDANFGHAIKNRCIAADAVVAPSPAIEQELVAGGYRRERIHYIANAVPLPERLSAAERRAAREAARTTLATTAAAFRFPPGAPLAVYTGRLCEEKGLGELIDAWARVEESRPQARLCLVGEGPMRAELLRRIDAAGLIGTVVLAGAFDDVEDFLRAADLFVLPSWEEGLSLSLLEAMAAELPIVASEIPANRVVVGNEQQGLLVPTRDAAALAAAILRLMDRPDDTARMAVAARARVAEAFSLEQSVSAHLVLFERLCRESSNEATQ
jgi:glycosyltransferase involved in cell wall biosynthesis